MNNKIVILGVGNLLMSDDGVGIHAIRLLERNPPPGAQLVDAGTDVLSTLPFLEHAARALIIDAMCAGGKPGELFQITEKLLKKTDGSNSAHAVNIIAGRHLLSPGANWPEILILGVEPAVLDYGMSLSTPVAAALPHIECLSREIVAAWQKQLITS
jgi:hydrogenase maturation protease